MIKYNFVLNNTNPILKKYLKPGKSLAYYIKLNPNHANETRCNI